MAELQQAILNAQTFGAVLREVSYEYARSSGPGGQHVNKVSTRVTLCFDVPGSTRFSGQQKRLLRTRLATRISKEGVLRVRSQKYRSRGANQRAVQQRFRELLTHALQVPKRRVKTRVPKSATRQRISQKRKRGQVKTRRRRPSDEE